MKTLFTINIKVTRPYGTIDDDKIKQDYSELFATALQRFIADELSQYEIVGLNVEVKVK